MSSLNRSILPTFLCFKSSFVTDISAHFGGLGVSLENLNFTICALTNQKIVWDVLLTSLVDVILKAPKVFNEARTHQFSPGYFRNHSRQGDCNEDCLREN